MNNDEPKVHIFTSIELDEHDRKVEADILSHAAISYRKAMQSHPEVLTVLGPTTSTIYVTGINSVLTYMDQLSNKLRSMVQK